MNVTITLLVARDNFALEYPVADALPADFTTGVRTRVLAARTEEANGSAVSDKSKITRNDFMV